jgi:hypothetical protein
LRLLVKVLETMDMGTRLHELEAELERLRDEASALSERRAEEVHDVWRGMLPVRSSGRSSPRTSIPVIRIDPAP